MNLELTPEQRAARAEFRAFVAAEIAPHAGRWDREAATPAALIDELREPRLSRLQRAGRSGAASAAT